MSTQKENFTTPVGRLVQGSLYKAQTTDAENRPLVVKNGPNAGQARVDYFFALAIPKVAGQHWAATEWGAILWRVGHAFMPTAGQNPKFAWKITDGDSQVPNARGRRPCDREGYPGNWVLNFSGGFAPKIYHRNGDGWVPSVDQDAVKLGYYVQVNGNVDSNGSQQQPGIYLNHAMVALCGYGAEIVVGPDVSQAGFGAAPLPSGASATPLAGPPLPAAPVTTAPPPLVPGLPPAPNGGNTGLSSVSAPPPAPVPANLTPATSAKVLTSKAGPHSYETLIHQGWTDETLIANGYMLAPVAAGVPAPLPPGGSVPMPPGHVATAPAPIPVHPNPGFMQVAPPPVTPGVTGRVMLPAANGVPYESWIAEGWNDAILVQHGYMRA